MPIPALAWAILPSVVSTATSIASRPKKRDYVPNTSYIDKYIANLQGRRSSREVERMAMNPALRAVGQQYGRGIRQSNYDAAKYGLSGSGIDIQQKLSLNQQATGALTQASEQAGAMQYQENNRIEDYIQQLTMQKGQMEEEGTRAFRQAKRQSNADIIGGLAQMGATIGAGVSQNIAAKKAAGQVLNFQDVLDDVASGTMTKENIGEMYNNKELSLEQVDAARNLMRTIQVKSQQDTDKLIGGTIEKFGPEAGNLISSLLAANVPKEQATWTVSKIMGDKEAMDADIQSNLESVASSYGEEGVAMYNERVNSGKSPFVSKQEVGEIFKKREEDKKDQEALDKQKGIDTEAAAEAEIMSKEARANGVRLSSNIESQFGTSKPAKDISSLIENKNLFITAYENGTVAKLLNELKKEYNTKSLTTTDIFMLKTVGVDQGDFDNMNADGKKETFFRAMTAEMQKQYNLYIGLPEQGKTSSGLGLINEADNSMIGK